MKDNELIKAKSVKYPMGYMAIYLAIQMFFLYNIVVYGYYVLGQSNMWGTYLFAVVWGLGNIIPIFMIKLSDKWGYKESLIIASVLQILGFFFMSLGSVPTLVLGAALFGTSMCFSVSQNYVVMSSTMKKEYTGRFNIFLVSYSLMNATAFVTGLVSGMAPEIGYANVFRIGMICSIIILAYVLIFYNRSETFEGTMAHAMSSRNSKEKMFGFLKLAGVALITFVIFYLFTLIARTINIVIDISVFGTFVFLIYLALKNKGIVRRKIFVFIVLSLISLVFWIGYNMYTGGLFTSILDSASKLHGVSVQWALASDPFIIVIFGAFLSVVFMRIEKKGYHFNALLRIVIGLSFLTIGMLVIVLGFHVSHFQKIDVLWVMVAIGICGFGEIFIGPVSTAVAGATATKELEGVFIAVGFLIVGGTGAISAAFTSWMLSPGPKAALSVRTHQMAYVIGIFAMIALLAAIVMAILYKPMTKAANFIPFKMKNHNHDDHTL